MPSFSSFAFSLLLSLLLGIETPSAAPVAAPETQGKPVFTPHTPSTFHLEVGDLRNARFVAVQRGVGLFHTHSAQLGTPGVLHLSLLGSYSHLKQFPELAGSDLYFSDIHRVIGGISAAYTFLPWLEAYASYEVSSSFANLSVNKHQQNEPEKVSGQILGDINLGTKFSYGFVPSFYSGLDLGVRTFNVGNTMDAMSFAFRPSLLLAWNLQELSSRLPLILHSNLGLYLNIGKNTNLLAENDPSRARWQTFAWNLNNRHHVFLNLAMEVPLPHLTPFVEYRHSFPYWLEKDNAPAQPNPQALTLGAKLTLLPNITFNLGGEFNLKSPQLPGVAPHPPWRFFFGLSMAIAPSASVHPPTTAEAPTLSCIPEEAPAVVAAAPPPPQLLLALRRGHKLVSGQVHLRGPNPQSFLLSEEAPAFSIPPGPQVLEIIPEDGLAFVKKVNMAAEQTQAHLLRVEPSPASPAVRLVNQRLLLAEPLAFTPNSAELTPHGHAQLRSLVDFLIRHHIQRIRIESHVESQRAEGAAMQLSAQRSQIVVEALVGLGMDAARMEVLNAGDSRPVAPNTGRGRQLNRRLDFFVVEKWESTGVKQE